MDPEGELGVCYAAPDGFLGMDKARAHVSGMGQTKAHSQILGVMETRVAVG